MPPTSQWLVVQSYFYRYTLLVFVLHLSFWAPCEGLIAIQGPRGSEEMQDGSVPAVSGVLPDILVFSYIQGWVWW